MHRENNIFYKAIKKDENHTTELFCNLLKFDYIRNLLLNFFNKNSLVNIPIETLKYESINTQIRIKENNKQPDIVIENQHFYCFFEIKVKNSDLQESQITDYPAELEKYEKNKKIKLIYLIPNNYKYEDTIIEEVINKKKYADIFYWEDFLKYIENTDLPKSNILISEFITFLKLVLGKQDLSLTLNLEEMALLQNPKDLINAKNLLNKLYDIIDDSSQKVVDYFEAKIKIFSQTKRNEISNEYAVYFTDEDEEYILFFGLWFDMVEDDITKYGDKLMCFGVSIDDEDYNFGRYAEKFKTLYKSKSFEANNWLLSHFDKYALANEDETKLIENISKKLIYTIEKLLK